MTTTERDVRATADAFCVVGVGAVAAWWSTCLTAGVGLCELEVRATAPATEPPRATSAAALTVTARSRFMPEASAGVLSVSMREAKT